MTSSVGSFRGLVKALILVAALLCTAGTAHAQWGYGMPGFGYGMGYGYGMPGYGYGMLGYGMGYGMGYGYGMPGFGYGMGYGYGMPGFGYGMGYGYGMPFYGYGMGAWGNPGLGFYWGSPGFGVFGSGSPLVNSPYLNPLFGVGMTPLGLQSYLVETNLLGRGQLGAAQRARARQQQGNNGQ